MFSELMDKLSLLWSWTWPETNGEIIEVVIERTEDDARLSVCYRFYVGEDGPYTGESFWKPWFTIFGSLQKARRKLRRGDTVVVRFRPGDPSVNKVDRSVWRRL